MAAPAPIKAHHEARKAATADELAVALCKQSKPGKDCFQWTATLDAQEFIRLLVKAGYKTAAVEADPPPDYNC